MMMLGLRLLPSEGLERLSPPWEVGLNTGNAAPEAERLMNSLRDWGDMEGFIACSLRTS